MDTLKLYLFYPDSGLRALLATLPTSTVAAIAVTTTTTHSSFVWL